jgi:flagellar biosynthesis/type III secretory pathway chaperone
MEELLKKFLGLLEGETALYRSLLLVLQKEKRAVVDSELDVLNESSKEKENLILKIRILEEQRDHLQRNLADFLGYSNGQALSMSALVQAVEEPYSSRLKSCCSNLLTLTQSIQEVNNSNKFLIMNSLELVRGSLTLLNNLIASNAVYYKTGMIQTGDQSGRLFSGTI